MLRIPVSGSLMIAIPDAMNGPGSSSDVQAAGILVKSTSSPVSIISFTGASARSTITGSI